MRLSRFVPCGRLRVKVLDQPLEILSADPHNLVIECPAERHLMAWTPA